MAGNFFFIVFIVAALIVVRSLIATFSIWFDQKHFGFWMEIKEFYFPNWTRHIHTRARTSINIDIKRICQLFFLLFRLSLCRSKSISYGLMLSKSEHIPLIHTLAHHFHHQTRSDTCMLQNTSAKMNIVNLPNVNVYRYPRLSVWILNRNGAMTESWFILTKIKIEYPCIKWKSSKTLRCCRINTIATNMGLYIFPGLDACVPYCMSWCIVGSFDMSIWWAWRKESARNSKSNR